jgi:hypothetical protein
MQAVAAKSSGYAGKPLSLFELRRILLLFEEKILKTVCFDSLILNRRVVSV